MSAQLIFPPKGRTRADKRARSSLLSQLVCKGDTGGTSDSFKENDASPLRWLWLLPCTIKPFRCSASWRVGEEGGSALIGDLEEVGPVEEVRGKLDRVHLAGQALERHRRSPILQRSQAAERDRRMHRQAQAHGARRVGQAVRQIDEADGVRVVPRGEAIDIRVQADGHTRASACGKRAAAR